MKNFLLPVFLFFTNAVCAQEVNGGPDLNTIHFNDSLTSSCDKNSNGCYYKGFQLAAVSGSRVYVHFSAFGPSNNDLSLLIMDTQEGGQTIKYFCKKVAGTCLGTIELDSTFAIASNLNIIFSSANPGETFSYDADVVYGSPEALAYQSQGNLCWKIGYILKNSENGFRFISSPDQYHLGTFATSTPILPEAPTESYIVKDMSSLYYGSTISRGSKEETTNYFDQVATAMKMCLGTNWNYETTTDDKGCQHLRCTISAPTTGVDMRNLSYMGNNMKDELPKYDISFYIQERTIQGTTIYELKMSVSNLFYQF